MNIELSNVLSVHANFLNIWNSACPLNVTQLGKFESLMCDEDRFEAVCQSDIVTIGEVRSTEDKWGRKAILLGIGLKECIVIYERYVQGDEGFITTDVPRITNIDLGFKPKVIYIARERLCNADLLNLAAIYNKALQELGHSEALMSIIRQGIAMSNYIYYHRGDETSTSDGKFVWPEWHKHFFDDRNGLRLKHDVDHSILIAEIIKYHSTWRIHHTEYFEESVIRVGVLSLFNGLEVTPIPLGLIPEDTFDISELRYDTAAIIPIIDHDGFVLSILAEYSAIGFEQVGVRYYYYGGFNGRAGK